MNQDSEDYSLSSILNTFRDFLSFLLKKWVWAGVCLLIAVGGAVLYYFKQPSKFSAATTFILEDKGGAGAGGGLAGIASQFGVNLGGIGGGAGIFAGDNVLDILRSKTVLRKVLLTTAGTGTDSAKTLADLYLNTSELGKKWNSKGFKDVSFSGKKKFTPIEDSLLNAIYLEVSEKSFSADRLRRQGGIIVVQVLSSDATFSRELSIRTVAEAGDLYLKLKTGVAQENINRLQTRADSLLVMLNSTSYRAASSLPLDINPGIKLGNVPTEILNRDKTVLATLYAEVVKNLEASRLLLAQQTPVIQLLDEPEILLKNNKAGIVKTIAIAVVLIGFIFIGVVFLLFVIKRVTQKIVAKF